MTGFGVPKISVREETGTYLPSACDLNVAMSRKTKTSSPCRVVSRPDFVGLDLMVSAPKNYACIAFPLNIIS